MNEQIEIVRRFFEALNYLKVHKVIRGVATFTKKYDINRGVLYMLEQDPERSLFKPQWLTYLVRDYGLSAEWLLTGRGEIVPVKRGRKPSKPANNLQIPFQ